MTRLTDNINSKLIENLNKLHGRNQVYVYVESEDDIPFWKFVFNLYKIDTKISPASKTDLTRGKQKVLEFVEDSGKYLVLCVDSDYDYMMDGHTAVSGSMKAHPYIFQTYTYSIENYMCYAGGLHAMMVDASLVDEQTFDYELFLTEYSKIIYELFVHSFIFHRQFSEDMTNCPMTVSEFCAVIKIPNQVVATTAGKEELTKLSERVHQKLSTLAVLDTVLLEESKAHLASMGLLPENTYLFIQGHTLFNNVVMMFLPNIFNTLKTEKHKSFTDLSQTDAELAQNRRNAYKKHTAIDIYIQLRTHKYYQDCFLFHKIKTDIEQYLTTK